MHKPCGCCQTTPPTTIYSLDNDDVLADDVKVVLPFERIRRFIRLKHDRYDDPSGASICLPAGRNRSWDKTACRGGYVDIKRFQNRCIYRRTAAEMPSVASYISSLRMWWESQWRTFSAPMHSMFRLAACKMFSFRTRSRTVVDTGP